MAQSTGIGSTARIFGTMLGAVALTVVIGTVANAQALSGGIPQGSPLRQRMGDAAARQARPEQAPDTLPGAKARAPAAPASKAPADMSPNDAMFDAINRGDIATVKDALSRGAQLDARNVLGMTPLELSVDLGRNDISFLLLSMRSEGAPPPRASLQAEAKRPAARSAEAAHSRAAARSAAVVASPRVVTTPKLFANDGGTPVPNAGFLGFDSRSTN